MELPVEILLWQPLFSWLPEDGLRVLASCFRVEAEELAAGESRESGERIGCLLEGRLSLQGETAGSAEAGMLFGSVPTADGQGWTKGEQATARETSVIV